MQGQGITYEKAVELAFKHMGSEVRSSPAEMKRAISAMYDLYNKPVSYRYVTSWERDYSGNMETRGKGTNEGESGEKAKGEGLC